MFDNAKVNVLAINIKSIPVWASSWSSAVLLQSKDRDSKCPVCDKVWLFLSPKMRWQLVQCVTPFSPSNIMDMPQPLLHPVRTISAYR